MTFLKTAGAMTGMALLGALLAVNAREKLLRPAVSISPPAEVVAKIDTPPVELQSSPDLTHGWWDTLGAPPSICPPEATPLPRPRKPQLNLPIPR